MKLRFLLKSIVLAAGSLAFLSLLPAFQREFRVYPGEGEADAPLPPDYNVPGDFILGRLMYGSSGGRGGGGGWAVDYPKGDRVFAQILRRLTRVHVRSVEQPVDPSEADDIYNWPYLHVAMPGNWVLSPDQANRIRDHLLRGGFLVCDSFFGSNEWARFEIGLRMIFPDRLVEEIPDDDAIFNVVYNLKERSQVGNFRRYRSTGIPYRDDGAVAKWLGIRDDQGRIVVMMSFNSDLGDSWQNADIPQYPQEWSNLGLRLGVNYVTYALTH